MTIAIDRHVDPLTPPLVVFELPAISFTCQANDHDRCCAHTWGCRCTCHVSSGTIAEATVGVASIAQEVVL
ncbi:MAG: hypothetical protein ACYCS4_07845 [Acidimicrobiales bacterium]